MRGNKRRTSSLQAVAVAAVCLLFAATALFGCTSAFPGRRSCRRAP